MIGLQQMLKKHMGVRGGIGSRKASNINLVKGDHSSMSRDQCGYDVALRPEIRDPLKQQQVWNDL